MSELTLTVPPRSVFAGVLLWSANKAAGKGEPGWPTVVDLTNKIVELKRNRDVRLDTRDISIRADLNGWISDDLSSFVERLVLFGLANEDPINLSTDALVLCKKILVEDAQENQYRGGIERLSSALSLNLDTKDPGADS